jgi:hypothetical protein
VRKAEICNLAGFMMPGDVAFAVLTSLGNRSFEKIYGHRRMKYDEKLLDRRYFQTPQTSMLDICAISKMRCMV